MKYRPIFCRILLLQVCVCVLLVSFSNGQPKTSRGPAGKVKRPKPAKQNHSPGGRKVGQSSNVLLPWVEPPESCGRIPSLEKKITDRPLDRPSTGARSRKPASAPRRFSKPKRPRNYSEPFPFRENSIMASEGHWPSFVYVTQREEFYDGGFAGDDPNSPEVDEVICGGALVAKNVVITAAHCVENAHERPVTVTVGLSSFNTKNRKNIEVEKFWFHPDACKSDRKWQLLDFAILILKYNVNYTDHIQPACFQPNFAFDRRASTFHLVYADNHSYRRNNTNLSLDGYSWPCKNEDQDFSWLRKTHECYENKIRRYICDDHYASPLYFQNAERPGYEKRYSIAGLGSFRSNGSWYDDCTTNNQNGAYFFDFYRAREFIPMSLEGAVPPGQVNPHYASRKCFWAKRRFNPYNETADFDHLLDSNGILHESDYKIPEVIGETDNIPDKNETRDYDVDN